MTDDKAAPITEGQTPRTDASTNLWLLARQLELELAACEAATRERCAKELDETVAHILDNAQALKKWPHMADEARARELGSTYLREAAFLFRSRALDALSPAPVESYDCLICGGIVHGPFKEPSKQLHQRSSGKRPAFPALECPKCGYQHPAIAAAIEAGDKEGKA